MNYIQKLSSAVINNIRSGLVGFSGNPSLSQQLVEDEIVLTYQNMIKKYILKNIIPKRELILTIRCIPVDCEDIERCHCFQGCSTPMAHFQIPQIFTDSGNGMLIDYVGSVDMQRPFIVFTNPTTLKYSTYSRRGHNYPRVWIDTTPNCNNLNDAFIWNAPLIKAVTVSAIFKDPRQIEDFVCNTCNKSSDMLSQVTECDPMINNMNFMDTEIIQIVTEKFIKYYKQLREPDTIADLSNKRP